MTNQTNPAALATTPTTTRAGCVVTVGGRAIASPLETAKWLERYARFTEHFDSKQPIASNATITQLERDLDALIELERFGAPHGSKLEEMAKQEIEALKEVLISFGTREEQPELTWGTVTPWWGEGIVLDDAEKGDAESVAQLATDTYHRLQRRINAKRLETAARVELAKLNKIAKFNWRSAWSEYTTFAKETGVKAKQQRALARAAERHLDAPAPRPEFLTSEWFEGEDSQPESDGGYKYPSIVPALDAIDVAEMATRLGPIVAHVPFAHPARARAAHFWATDDRNPDDNATDDGSTAAATVAHAEMLATVASPPPAAYSGPSVSARYAGANGPLFGAFPVIVASPTKG